MTSAPISGAAPAPSSPRGEPSSRPWFEFVREEGDTYLLALVRLSMGCLLLVQVWKAASYFARVGYFGEHFHLPLVPEAWVPTRPVYLSLLAVQALGAMAAVMGRLARTGLLVSSLTGLYLLVCDRLQYHNNRYVLLLIGLLLAFTPCDRYLVFPPPSAPIERRGPLWARRLIQGQLALVYLASGGGKLLDPDWRGGQVIRVRLMRSLELALARGLELPEWLPSLLTSPALLSAACKLAIALELTLAFALFFRKTRVVALWLGVWFHLGIELTSRVEVFSWLVLTVYVLFARPELQERVLHFDPGSARSRRLARWVRIFDWLRRYRFEAAPAHFERVQLRDRDGRMVEGHEAWLLLARTLPALFPLWLPWAAWTRLRTRPRASQAPITPSAA